MKTKNMLSGPQRQWLLQLLEHRFAQHPERHPDLRWETVTKRLRQHPERLWSLNEMERSGGEPDVVMLEQKSAVLVFADCSPESPARRRSLCYDYLAWKSRKTARPAGNAVDMAAAMGIELLTEEQYFLLQHFGPFDTKTSSWLLTPPEIRKLGGALFGDHRFGRTFIYHNGAESYFSSRGFRGLLRI